MVLPFFAAAQANPQEANQQAANQQPNPHNIAKAEAAFVDQAPEPQDRRIEAPPQVNAPAASKVYFPDAITPEAIARARARSAQQDQVAQSDATRDESDTVQVASGSDGARDVDQLSDGSSSEALAQLTEAERQVLLDAVEGTDICEKGSDIPAIRDLCEKRIETRSAEFAQNSSGSAEDSLLGGGLDADRLATLESAIARLANNTGNSNDFSNQVIASVALNNQTLADNSGQSSDVDPTNDLTPETQAVVNAIVQQLGGN